MSKTQNSILVKELHTSIELMIKSIIKNTNASGEELRNHMEAMES